MTVSGANTASCPATATRSATSYDWYVGIRGKRVEPLWPIIARGAVY
jgi:hypothetical protein